jgi:hypothetical protein
LRIDYRTDDRAFCRRNEEDDSQNVFAAAPIPWLYPPEGVAVLDDDWATGGGRGYLEARARAKSGSSPDEIVAGYEEQLREQGWRLTSRNRGDVVSAQTWTLDRDGQRWSGLLLVQALPAEARLELIFRIVTPDGGE